MKILSVVGARPNFMKVAPIHRALLGRDQFISRIVHTGQHYDARMSEVFFNQLELPEPHIYLGVGSGTHAQQTAKVMVAFEEVIVDEKPDLVLVVGDVNSTLACSLVSAKCHVPIAHVEAGLRSGDRSMPEEINRIVTDSISEYLFVTEQSGVDNLRAEGVPARRVFLVGNVMIDSLVRFRDKASEVGILIELGLTNVRYALMTMHRPSNVDNDAGLNVLVETIERITDRIPLVFPVHPRTRQRLEVAGLNRRLEKAQNLILLEPLGYLEFLRLMENAAVVITDSGGIQEETTFLQVPCLTLRENTERPITIEAGTNELSPLNPLIISQRMDKILTSSGRRGTVPPMWDGNAAERLIDILEDSLRPASVAA